MAQVNPRLMRVILLFLFTVCALPVCAQVSIGVIGGSGHAAFRTSYRPELPSIEPIPTDISQLFAPRWRAGFLADIQLRKHFYLQPQLVISTKGNKYEYKSIVNDYTHTGTNRIRLTYLELPVNLLYKIPIGNGKLVAGGGPYIAKTLSGIYNNDDIAVGPNSTTKTHKRGKLLIENEQRADLIMPQSFNSYKEQDAGLNFIAGYECRNGLLFHINYSLGLTSVYTYHNSESHIADNRKNTYFGISAGYLFKLR
jgi:hypothetical protein